MIFESRLRWFSLKLAFALELRWFALVFGSSRGVARVGLPVALIFVGLFLVRWAPWFSLGGSWFVGCADFRWVVLGRWLR